MKELTRSPLLKICLPAAVMGLALALQLLPVESGDGQIQTNRGTNETRDTAPGTAGRESREHENEPIVPVPGTAGSQDAAPEVVSDEGEHASSPFQGEAAEDHELPMAQDVRADRLAVRPHRAKDRYADAEIIVKNEYPPDSRGWIRRIRIVRTDSKYPLTHVDELVVPDPADNKEVVLKQSAMVADHILITTQPGTEVAEIEALNHRYGATIRRKMHTPDMYIIAFEGADLDAVADAIRAYSDEPAVVRRAGPDLIYHAAANTPNDPYFNRQWGLHNANGPDIGALQAWDISTDCGDVLVAVIDSGVDYGHEDLARNMWVNPGEIPGNGRDDDNNGYVDDVHGWDFGDDDNDPMDYDSHGTHCAGIIGAVGNNGVGVAGVAWKVRMVALKHTGGQTGTSYSSDSIDAIHYASRIGVYVISASWGGDRSDPNLEYTIGRYCTSRILFVAAAGNGGDDLIGDDNDHWPMYPASYSFKCIISVANTDSEDRLAGSSNFGRTSVDLGAPGTDIWSCIPGSYGYKSGTSMATPYVAGACALLIAKVHANHPQEIKMRLMKSVDRIPALSGKCVSGGRLNLNKALGGGKPGIDVSPTTIRQSVRKGQNSGDSFFEVWNTGDGHIRYTVSVPATAPWLTVNPSAGGSDGERDEIRVSYDPTGLATGLYSATISVNASISQAVNPRPPVRPGPPGGRPGGGGGRVPIIRYGHASGSTRPDDPKTNITKTIAVVLRVRSEDDLCADDYDGDGKTDVAVFYPADGVWSIQQSGTGQLRQEEWGRYVDIPVPGDYDGDGKTDVAIFWPRPDGGTWYIQESSTGETRQEEWGCDADVPVPADYDGDGKADVAVFWPRSDGGTWFIQESSTGQTREEAWGRDADVPVPADYDGDGKTDVAIYYPAWGTWYILQSSTGGLREEQVGTGGGVPVLPQYRINRYYGYYR